MRRVYESALTFNREDMVLRREGRRGFWVVSDRSGEEREECEGEDLARHHVEAGKDWFVKNGGTKKPGDKKPS
jgi:hypothetical protein